MKHLRFIGRILLVAVCLFACNVRAWNSTGHMTVAELAWRAMSRAERAAASQLLRNHPHYAELLEAGLVAGVDHDEWVFLRAATWPDLVRPAMPGQPPKPESITQFQPVPIGTLSICRSSCRRIRRRSTPPRINPRSRMRWNDWR